MLFWKTNRQLVYRTGSVVILALGLVMVGCGPQIPPCYKVTGKVVTGDKPWTEGNIVFISTKDPEQRANGFIGSDGTFSLTTRMLGMDKEGAPEGEYTILVEDPKANVAKDGQFQYKPVIPKQEKYTVEAKENNFTIDVIK